MDVIFLRKAGRRLDKVFNYFLEKCWSVLMKSFSKSGTLFTINC